jgi:hypothetical protein
MLCSLKVGTIAGLNEIACQLISSVIITNSLLVYRTCRIALELRRTEERLMSRLVPEFTLDGKWPHLDPFTAAIGVLKAQAHLVE